MIPQGEASKPEQTWFFREKPLCIVFSGPSQNKFCSVIQKQNQPDSSVRLVCSGFGGERGIRTPGPPIGGQRFSRPPHSTTLPFLHKLINSWPQSATEFIPQGGTISPFIRRNLGKGGIFSPAQR